MLEIIKYGSSKYGCWVLGTLKVGDLEIKDIFNTNIDDEEFFKDKTSCKVKKVKISRNSNKKYHVLYLEF